MHEVNITTVLATLSVALIAAKIFGAIAKRVGQPAVLGEMVAGVILGGSLLHWVDPHVQYMHVLSELGVIILLFEIGMETDLKKLLQVGAQSMVTAAVGVIAPFVLGYLVCWWLGTESLVAVVVAASLTATSVGITARVLSDLNRLDDAESRIIIGAAVFDDIIGLIILAVVTRLTEGQALTVGNVAWISVAAFGFLAITVVAGGWLVPYLVRAASKLDLPGTPTMLGVILALGLAWLAAVCGSAMIIGAFAAGLLLRQTPKAEEIEHGVAELGHFFIPIFFVSVGAAVDVSVLNPLQSENYSTLMIAGLLIVVAVVGKYVAGYAPFWFKGNKQVIGVGMIPRGEVGLIFAQMGLSTGVFDDRMFGAVTIMVMVTTFVAPPWLKTLLHEPATTSPLSRDESGLENLVNDP
ncbi:MAG: cation:proton antiporter [Pirellulales bacterium]